MKKRISRVAILAVLTVVLVLGFAGGVFAAPSWSDLPSTVTAKYGVTDFQVASISDGYGRVWKPFQNITRAQFTKMAVTAFKVSLADWDIASFVDVPKGNYYFKWIEGARAAGMVNGVTLASFKPNDNITRQQAIAIVSRYIAKVNGYDLATMYAAAEIDALLGVFGDAAAVDEALRAEVAFAIDFGITEGNAQGNLAPGAKLLRIQAAAFLIRATAKIPSTSVTPAKIALVTVDKGENLIGRPHKVTFRVTDAGNNPAAGVLVDFDTMYADPFYVGNISPQAAMTNGSGEVTVNLFSAEPGTQRLSAAVRGLAAIYTTKYWLALDEVYTVGTRTAQNNAGTPHEWGVRVVIFGPGPRSTAQFDWYNAVSSTDFDAADIKKGDGLDASCDWVDGVYGDFGDGWSYSDELELIAEGYVPRTMAGIDVQWALVNVRNDDLSTPTVDETVPSAGMITAVDGVSVAPVLAAVGRTDAEGFSKIKVEYTSGSGQLDLPGWDLAEGIVAATTTQAIASYSGNPYPKLLFAHETFRDGRHDLDWDGQPSDNAVQRKTWIAHTLPPQTGPITPAYSTLNIGEEKTLTLNLVDVNGNPIAGREVLWTMQGVGFFQTDDLNDVSRQDSPGSVDYDTTGPDGKATVFVKSYKPGEQIVHAKVRDKGTGGAEGAYQMHTAEVQWFDVDVVTFDDPTTTEKLVRVPNKKDPTKPDALVPTPVDEAVSSNPVGATHTFTLRVYGLKLELDAKPDDPAHQTAIIDGDTPGSAYDRVFDAKDAAYLGGILLVNPNDLNIDTDMDGATDPDPATDVQLDVGGKIVESWDWDTVLVRGREIQLSYLGGYTMFDSDGEGTLEWFTGRTGIYLPLAGKKATFTVVDSENPAVPSVGNITAPTGAVVTGADGTAAVIVTSTQKGPERIKGTVTWQGNPHGEVKAWAQKSWVAGQITSASALVFSISVDGVQVADNNGEIAIALARAYDGATTELGSAHVEVRVKDQFGNDLPDYEVVYLLNSIGQEVGNDTYVPLAYLVDHDEANELPPVDPQDNYDQNGPRPDADEPTPESDPFSSIVGDGGTQAFFFNQWLGTSRSGMFWSGATTDEGQPGVPHWPLGRVFGGEFDQYYVDAAHYWILDDWDIAGFDGLKDGSYTLQEDIGLATDGAKAWTLDSYYSPDGIAPNLLLGSNIDIQLADEGLEGGRQTRSILRVMIYAPSDGLVTEGTPIYSTQVHVLWEVPMPTTILLTPAYQVKIAGRENASVTGQVLDQFGDPMENVLVAFTTTQEEPSIILNDLDDPVGPVLTGPDGGFAATWSQDVGDFGVQKVIASAGAAKSGAVVVDWALDDQGKAIVSAAYGTKTVVVKSNSTYSAWDGKLVNVFLNPAQASINNGTFRYRSVGGVAVDTTHTFLAAFGEPFFVRFDSTRTDGAPNWVYGWSNGAPTP